MIARPLSWFAALSISGIAAVDASAANCGGATVCVCGDTVTSSYTLTANIACAPARPIGLTIGANNVVLDGNGFALTMNRTNSTGIVLTGFSGATVQDLTVNRQNAGIAGVKGITLNNADGAVLSGNTLDGLATGITNQTSTSSNVQIVDNSVRSTTTEAMNLRLIDGAFVLTGNDFTSSKKGLLLANLVGPWSLDASNVFADVGRAESDWVVKLERVEDITLDGLDLSTSPATNLSYHRGFGVAVHGSDGLVITNCDLSGHDTGIFTTQIGADANTNGVITGNDVSDTDVWGMELENWDETLTFANNTFDLCDNGIRLVEIDPSAGNTLTIDFDGSSFQSVGEGTTQTAVKVVRSHDMIVENLVTTMVSRGTGVKLEDSDHIDLDNVLVCGTTRVGIDLNVNDLDVNSIEGADDSIVGSPGGVYVDDADTAGIRISVESSNNTIAGVIARGDGAATVDLSATTTGAATRLGTAGWAYDDGDGDLCNDLCGDGVDLDSDSYCDAGDFAIDGGALFDASQVSWTTGGVGSPSVVWDDDGGQFVMVYETQTGAADATCKNGYWSLGLATSPDGQVWTDAGGPLLSPVTGTYYACVAAHPSIVQNGSTTVVFFKAEKEAIANVARYTGVGRLVLQWNAGNSQYDVLGPDPTVVLTQKKAFGYVRALYDDTAGTYRLAMSRFPRMAVSSGPAAGPFPAPVNVVDPGDIGWGPDEVFNPAVTCGIADEGFSLFLGGRALSGSVGAQVVDDQGLGRMVSDDFVTWNTGTVGATVATTSGDSEMRHWDVLPIGESDFVLFYDDQSGPGGQNQIRVATTSDLAWDAALAATVGDKVCNP